MGRESEKSQGKRKTEKEKDSEGPGLGIGREAPCSFSHTCLLKLTVLGVGKPKDGRRQTEQGERQSEESGGGEREPRAHLSSS